MRINSTIAAFVLTCLGAGVPLSAQTAMAGIVRDDSTGRPLSGVEVLLGGTAHTTVTNAAGRYVLAGLPAGNHQAIFRIVGYLPTRVTVLLSVGDTLRVNQVLVPSTVVLDPIEVTGEAMSSTGLAGPGFEERRKMGFGRFIDSHELRESEHLRVTDLLRRHRVEVHPIPVKPQSQVYRWVAMHPTRRDAAGRLNCPMVTYLDGALTSIEDLRTELDIASLAAVEVYRGAGQVPAQFGGTQAQCGVIVFWTRR